MAKQLIQTKQTDIASNDAKGRQLEHTMTVDDNCLPSPQELEQYKAIDPRIIDFLIDTTKKEQGFRHDYELKKLRTVNLAGRREFRINFWGMFFAALIMALGLSLAALLIYFDKIITGSVFGGVALVIAASVFISKKETPNDKRRD